MSPFDPDAIPNLDSRELVRLRQRRARCDAKLFDLLMKKRRKKEKVIVGKPKPGASLGNSAFAQDNALVAAAERVADQRPLFERVAHRRQTGRVMAPR